MATFWKPVALLEASSLGTNQLMSPQQNILISDLVQLNVNRNNKYRDIFQDTKDRSRRWHEPHGLEILERAFCRYDALELFSRR
jgi:hypothetical protein